MLRTQTGSIAIGDDSSTLGPGNDVISLTHDITPDSDEGPSYHSLYERYIGHHWSYCSGKREIPAIEQLKFNINIGDDITGRVNQSLRNRKGGEN